MTMLVWCLFTTVFVSSLASQETHRFVHISEDGKAVSQDIIHDKDENTVLVIVGDVSMYEGYIPTVNFHDFSTRFVAFKDIRRRICMVSETPYPNAMPELYRSGITNITKRYTAKDDPHRLTYDQVNLVAGQKIADFCKDYHTYLRRLIPKPEVQKRGQETTAANQEDARQLCIFCRIEFGFQDYEPCGDDIFG